MDQYHVYSLPKTVAGIYTCPMCQRDFSSEKTGRHYCPSCGLRIIIEVAAQDVELHSLSLGTAWDKKPKDGKISAFITTTLAGILRPRVFFLEVARHNRMLPAFTYIYCMYVLLFLLSFAASFFFWPYLQSDPAFKSLASFPALIQDIVAYFGVPELMIWIALLVLSILFIGFFVLFFILGFSFFCAIGNHILLFLVGGAKKPFSATYRAVCYSSITAPFLLVPIVNILGIFYSIFITIIALSRAHDIPWWRVLLAWILPPLFLFVFIFVINRTFTQ